MLGGAPLHPQEPLTEVVVGAVDTDEFFGVLVGQFPEKGAVDKTPSSTVTAGWFSSQTREPFLYSLNVMLTDGVSMAAPFESASRP